MDVSTFFETPGFGGAVALSVIVILVICYFLTLRWVARGQVEKTEEH